MSDTAQPTPETDEKKSRGFGSYVLWAFVAVMVYVLSWGPATWLTWNFSLPPPSRSAAGRQTQSSSQAVKLFTLVYSPVAWAYLRTALHKPLGMYMHVWCPDIYDKHGDPAIIVGGGH